MTGFDRLRGWFRPPDRLDERAAALPAAMAERFAASWDQLVESDPGWAGADRAEWCRAATVAATLMALFPLLRACGGDPTRYRRLRTRALAALEARYPASRDLVLEAESATVDPSGQERTRTLHEVDESTSLAMAGWVVRRVRGRAGERWDERKAVAAALRAAVGGYW